MSHLALGEKSVSELVEEVGVSQSAMSHQLRLLRDRSLVKSVRKGRNILYSLDDEHVVNLLRVGLEHASERFVMRSKLFVGIVMWYLGMAEIPVDFDTVQQDRKSTRLNSSH